MIPKQALQTYYGYDDFRPMQAEIIASVLAGQDTLGLMPTGGGKSLCFQIPAIVNEYLCLVITPLIALMHDQVENLRNRGIQAAAIYTGMRYENQQTALDNCQYGPYRCLYVSPERLENELFRIRLSRLPIGLIAVDEAHCISQWGYDFRPSYRHIHQVRELLTQAHPQQPVVPILALTATATPEVVDDIQVQLGFRAPLVYRNSFRRPNLQYIVRNCCADHQANTDLRTKVQELQHIVHHVPGSKIVYVRNRKRAQELAQVLNCSFYHAGLSSEERKQRQQDWKNTQTTMVCTNAFGMGVDKPDVRLVIHYDLPDSLEAYFQEAGRAGRDGHKAYAVLLYTPSDKTTAMRRIANNYPTREMVQTVYDKTCDFLGVGAYSGLGHSFALHIDELCHKMRLPVLPTYSALHLLDQAGYIHFEEEQETQARVMLNISRQEMEAYALSEPQQELLQTLMRQYPGIFTDLQYLHMDITQALHQMLANLAARHLITYIPRTRASLFTFAQQRQIELYLPRNIYEEREEQFTHRLRAMIRYAEQSDGFDQREDALLHYFGEI